MLLNWTMYFTLFGGVEKCKRAKRGKELVETPFFFDVNRMAKKVAMLLELAIFC